MDNAFTLMTEEESPEVGPNDIVIHLVNPYKCGMCELEFLEKTVFKEHIFTHLEQIKQDHPSSQIVVNIVLPPETPGGVTVTRDILQLGEDGSIKQVVPPSNNMTLNHVLPLKELEAAGVIKLEPQKPTPSGPQTVATLATKEVTPAALTVQGTALQKEGDGNPILETQESVPVLSGLNMLESANGSIVEFVKEEEEEPNMSDFIENTDGTFSVAFKGPNNKMQHIQIIRPDGMKGDMMLELTNVQGRRRVSKGAKTNECDICGKILSSSTNLIRHKMYHSAERPFVCDTCGKGFKDISNLKKHTMIHKRIFSCHLCKKSFLREALLTVHLKRHQSRTVYVKSGNSSKEVTQRTFVDEDGTRVDEMSMSALNGQTFEYKKRIVKADPVDTKPGFSEAETSTNADDTSALLPTEKNEQTSYEVTEDPDALPDLKSEINENSQAEDDVGLSIGKATMPTTPASKDFVKMYQCGHCGKRTVQRGNMMRHLIHHLREKPFKCGECPKQFVDKGELKKHMKTHTKPYRCHKCNGAFAHNVQLIKHQEIECLGSTDNLNYTVLEDGQTYCCDICHIQMKRLANMIKHVGTHRPGHKKYTSSPSTGSRVMVTTKPKADPAETANFYTFNTKSDNFECNVCNMSFSEKADVVEHVGNHQNGDSTGEDRPHQCSKCERWLPNRVALRKHSLIHLKPFKCDRCNMSFSRKLFLHQHKRGHDEKDKDVGTSDYGVLEDKSGYFCKHCDKKLNKKFRMMNHIRLHLSHRPFECPDCNKCFTFQYMLSKHRKSHTKHFICDRCGESFTRKFFLQIHKKKHQLHSEVENELVQIVKEGENRSYACRFCAKKIDDWEDIIDHVKGHLDLMHICKICGKSFSSKYLLEEHTSLHTKAFTCSYCFAPFSRLVIKANHERKCKQESKVLQRVPDNRGFQCKLCKKVATLKHNLLVHIRKAHNDLVRLDPFGVISLKGDAAEEEISKETPQETEEKAPREESEKKEEPPRKKARASSGKKKLNEEDLCNDDSDLDYVEEPDQGEEEMEVEDERYTRTPGGYACITCRQKFTEKESLFAHLEEAHADENKKPMEEKEETAPVQKEKDEQPMKMEEDSEVEEGKAVGTEPKGKKSKPGEDKKRKPGEDKKRKRSLSSMSPRGREPKAESTPQKTPTQDTSASSAGKSSISRRSGRTQKIPSRFLE